MPPIGQLFQHCQSAARERVGTLDAEEGVVVIPRHLAARIAQPAAEQEELERFILARIQEGAALPGTYPPDEATLAAFRAAREATHGKGSGAVPG